MKWLVPLGLLGLLGLIVLLIIYLIKPNFQKKAVSSTYVWKLSLKMRRKRNPINRMQDILLLLCQILAITCCALIMAQPVLEAFRPAPVNRKIAVIEASASMMAGLDGETRFDRALQGVRELADEVMADEGEISVILAGESARTLTVRTTPRTYAELTAALDELAGQAASACYHGSADVEGAMALAEQILDETPDAEVLYYSSKSYLNPGMVEVVDVTDPEEFNVAILDCTAVLEENFYSFEVDLASYGRDSDVTVYCEIYGANGAETGVTRYDLDVWLEGDQPKTLVFDAESTESTGIYAYQYAYFYINVEDSFTYDNMFYVYGGTKETIRIQYASSIPNIYFRGGIMSLRDTLRSRWDIEFVEINTNQKQPETMGFDFYIFERYTPSALPTDGVVMLVNPPALPQGLGMNLTGAVQTGNMYLSATGEHAVTDGVNAAEIFLSRCTVMTFSEDYEILLTCGRGTPAYAVRNDPSTKIVVMPFELQNSDGSIVLEFPKLFLRTFNYFFPSTIERNNFEVGESVQLNARATSLTVSGQGEEFELTDLPQEIVLNTYGTYTLSQVLFTNEEVFENFYVKIPNAESDFVTPIPELENPHVEALPEDEDYDLILFLAGALVLLLFVEWAIASRTQ